jgi:hypothetical protein
VPAHRDDSLGAHLLRREHAQQSDRAVTHDDDRRTWLHIRGFCRKPARAHHVGQREQARDQVRLRHVASPDESAVRERHAHARRLRADDGLEALTRRLIAVPAVRTRVVGGEERPDHELTGLDRRDAASDLLDQAAVFVPHRGRRRNRLNPAVRPQVGPADARERQADDCVCGLDDRRVGTIFKPDVARAI